MPTDNLPQPPEHLPESLQKKWQATYAAALKQAQVDIPGQEALQKAAARKEANKLQKVAMPEDHAGAAKLVDALKKGGEDAWKLIAHGVRKIKGVDHLSIVTSDGQKGLFPIPAAVASKPAPSTPPTPPVNS